MLQPFAFKGDFDETYILARAFLYRLSLAGVSVSLPDGFRSNTKTYPDYGTSVTIIEIFPDIATAEQVEMIEDIHAAVLAFPEQVEQTVQAEPVATVSSTSDDFDPFLDSDDLP